MQRTETRVSKCSVVPFHFTAHTTERVGSHSYKSTDTTISTHANDYVNKGKGAKPWWVQMGRGWGSLLKDNYESGHKVKVVEKNYVDYRCWR